ncbi:hypothetical protein PVAP13_3NG278841 [Panicum virgatum]|uniref:Uncharacterized protein n=1 Tax=Panicum virgatum TaxID=38727 RepID=A0A8T0UMX5_PANVG|nr:hypothetical protein PVAP13_3NG278841 [Panicum virgatum]
MSLLQPARPRRASSTALGSGGRRRREARRHLGGAVQLGTAAGSTRAAPDLLGAAPDLLGAAAGSRRGPGTTDGRARARCRCQGGDGMRRGGIEEAVRPGRGAALDARRRLARRPAQLFFIFN